jgi:malate dehydrogenase (oxaloacetate-decarboxylating)(NADP+)
MPAYEEALTLRFGAGRETMRQLTLKARQESRRIVFPDGTNEAVLRACRILADEGIATPILLGPENEVRAAIQRLGLDLGGVAVKDPAHDPRGEAYAEELFRLRARRGVTQAAARKRLLQCEYFAATMLHAGDADLMIGGLTDHFVESMRAILEVIGPAAGLRRISSHHLVLMPRAVYLLADCAVNLDPDAEELAEIALLAARMARTLNLEPHVAMLSVSNFGSVDHPATRKVRRAVEIVKARAPDLDCDGEMQMQTAVNGAMRRAYYPFSDLKKDANVLVFPDLQSGNLALDLLQQMGDALLVGPILMGARLPAHALRYGSTVEDIVNLAVTAVVESAAPRPAP